MKNCNIAILGATGAVGREMLNVLEEYDIPVSRLKLLSSARSAGSKIPFRGEDLTVEEATDASFEGMDFVLGAVKSGMSRAFAPAIVKSGAVYIDNSSAFRMDAGHPARRAGDQRRGREEQFRHHCQSQLLHDHHRDRPSARSTASRRSRAWSRARIRPYPAPDRADLRNSSARWTRYARGEKLRGKGIPLRRSRSTSSRSSAACSTIVYTD